jgi:4-amino-4-deoxy-L-arabinose transferase-like glycosyltransferase
VRLAGIDWGLPGATHLFSYHPDEFLVISAAQRVDLPHGQLDPHFYNYGSLYIYLVSLAAPLMGLLLGTPSGGPLTSQSLFLWHLAARVLTALLGTATVYVTYRLAGRAWGRQAGLLAAALLTLCPLHVVHSHYATVDVPATLFVTLSLWAVVELLALGGRVGDPPAKELGAPTGRRRPRRTTLGLYLLAGVAAGAAAATKYNAAAVLATLAVAHCCLPSRRARHLALAALAALLAFALLCPGSWLYTATFLRDVGFESLHTRTGHGLVFLMTGNGWWYHLQVNLWQSLGPAGTLLCLAAVAWTVLRRRPTELSLLAFVLVYCGAMGLFAVRFGRYMVPLMPVLMSLLAGMLATAWGQARPWGGRAALRAASAAAGALALMTFTALTATQLSYLGGIDPRDQALAWLKANAHGRSLALGTVPWFYSPPVSPFNGGDLSKRGFQDWQAQQKGGPIQVTGYDADALRAQHSDLVVLSSFEALDPLRLFGAPIADPAARQEVARFLGYWGSLARNYRLVATFGPYPAIPTPASAQRLCSHDWKYPSPTLWIWERKG